MKQSKGGSFTLASALELRSHYRWKKFFKASLPCLETVSANCTSLTESKYILKGRNPYKVISAKRYHNHTQPPNCSIFIYILDKDMNIIPQQSMEMRRDLVLTAAVAAVCSIAKVSEQEPKIGAEAANKKYTYVCATVPTAKIWRN
ncbi:unnamed protein product [Brassica napus]|uniref:Uncharacterized protein n=2 Tax=Brassica TaxID=3705 RepID=M4EJS0_BRACM|nr:unnamed protein product [Brassica napus]